MSTQQAVVPNPVGPEGGSASSENIRPIEPGTAVRISRPPTEAEIAQTYDQVAQTYFHHKHDTVTDFDVVGWPWLTNIMRGSNGSMQGVIGDLACGTGIVSKKLLGEFNPQAVVGIDISSKMLEIAASQVKDKRARFFQGSVTNMSMIPNEALDMAICTYGLPYMNVPEALNEVFRVLKPGSRFLSLVYHENRNQAYWEAGGNTGPFPEGWVAEAWPGLGDSFVKLQFLKRETYRRYARAVGFDVESIYEPRPAEPVEFEAPHIWQRYVDTLYRTMILVMSKPE